MFNAMRSRRDFLKAALVALVAAQHVWADTAHANSGSLDLDGLASRLAPSGQVRAGVLDVGYYEAGPADGPAVLLLHGFPYSVESYREVAPMLAERFSPTHRATRRHRR
jgi:hypothetical protein